MFETGTLSRKSGNLRVLRIIANPFSIRVIPVFYATVGQVWAYFKGKGPPNCWAKITRNLGFRIGLNSYVFCHVAAYYWLAYFQYKHTPRINILFEN